MNERNTNIQTQEIDPSLGAYPMDYVIPGREVPLNEDGSPVDPTGTLEARGDGSVGFHDIEEPGLFDNKSSVPDVATGELSKDLNEFDETEDVHVVGENDLALGKEALVGIDFDNAAEWLKENDPNYSGPERPDEQDESDEE